MINKCNQSKFIFNGKGITFNVADSWSFANDFIKNVIIFCVDNSSSYHMDNQKNNFWVIGEELTDDINDNGGIAEKKLIIIFTKAMQNFILAFYYSGD